MYVGVASGLVRFHLCSFCFDPPGVVGREYTKKFDSKIRENILRISTALFPHPNLFAKNSQRWEGPARGVPVAFTCRIECQLQCRFSLSNIGFEILPCPSSVVLVPRQARRMSCEVFVRFICIFDSSQSPGPVGGGVAPPGDSEWLRASPS